MSDALKFIPSFTTDQVRDEFVGPPKPARQYKRRPTPKIYTVTHILLWRDGGQPLPWAVMAGTDRGERYGEIERYGTYEAGERAAGRLAKATGATALLVSAGDSIRKIPYKRR